MDQKLPPIDHGQTDDALSIAWADTYNGKRAVLKTPDPTLHTLWAGVEEEIAKAVSLQMPYYDAWLEALQAFLPGTGMSIGVGVGNGSIRIATELVVRGHVPLEQILAVAAMCFAGCDRDKGVSYL